jgi:PAS domain S-box-containing protein
MKESESINLYLKEIERLKLENEKLLDKISTLESVNKPVQDSGNYEKYNAIIENAPWGIYISKPGQNIHEANMIACDIFGYTLDELRTKTRLDLILEDEAFERVLKQRHIIGRGKGEVTGIRKSGEKFPMEYSSLIFKDPISGELWNSSIIIDISERKKTERLIQETNEVARIGGWELDLIRNELTWSRITKEIHELDPDYKPDLETAINFFKDGWSRNLISYSVSKLISDGSAIELEVILVTAKGNEIWVKAQGKGEFEDGKCRRIYGCFQDINAQKLLQLREERQRANLKALLENIPDRVCTTDMEFNLTSFNTGFYTDSLRFTGIEPQIGINLMVFSLGLDWDELESFLKPVLKGYHCSKEAAVSLGKEVYYFEISASPIFDDSQTQIGISVFSRDITSRKQKEVLLLESREFYKSLFENNPDAAYSLSMDGNILTGNSGLIKLLEIDPEQLSDLHFSKFFPPEELERIGGYFQNLLKGIPNEFRSRIITANGTVKTVDNRTIPVMLNGEVISIFGIARDITLNLKKEEERKLVLETILDYFYVVDNEFNFTYVNEAAEKIMDKGPLVGKNLLETFPVLGQGLFFENLKKAQQTNKPVQFDYYSLETKTWFDENFYPHEDGISIFFRSVNDKKNAEQELQDQKYFFEQTFMQSAVSTILLDKDGYCLKINPKLSSIFGLPAEMVENKKYNVFEDPEISRQEIDKKIRSIIDQKVSVSWETKVDLSELQSTAPIPENLNSVFYLNVIGFPILDSEGNVSHVIMQHNDITESKKAEANLLESERKYRKLIENMGLGLMEVDNDQIILRAYPQFCKMTGYSEQELLGQNAFEILSKQVVNSYIVDKKIEDRKIGISDNYELRVKTKDGRVLDFLINGSPITNSKGEVTGSLGVHFDITERIKSVEELKQQKELAESIVSNIPIMISIISKEGRFISVNKTWEKELGWSEYETLNSPEFLPSLIPNEEVRNDVINFISMADGIWMDFDLVIRDGSIIHSSWTCIRLSDGRTIGIGQNITDRKRFEENLRLSNERFQYVTKATFDAIWDSDLIKSDVYWGEGFSALFGYGLDELKLSGLSFKEFLHPSDANRINESFQTAISGSETNWNGEYQFRKADGKYAFVQDRAIIIRDETGNAVRAIGAMQDISRQKEEEQRLKLLESVVTNSTDSILILEVNQKDGIQSKIVYSNEAFNKMTGYDRVEVIGKTIHFFEGKSSDENEFAKLNHALLSFSQVEVETVHYKKGGEAYWVYISLIPISNAAGQFTHWISIQRDTTGRKKRELEREELVKELTKSNKELKQFSYITSHNMRSPLTNLMAIADLIDTSLIPDETTVQLIEGFKSSTISLNETLEDLIKILIIKENTGLEREKIKFEEIYQQVISSIDSIIKESSAVIQTNFSGADSVVFNKSYMESIFMNLITNSIKYSKRGIKPVIFIYSILTEDTVKLVFEDDGLGFNLDKVKNKIFGLYQKFHNHPDSKGIGLYLVHSQVTSLGGSIEVESEVNQGAKFTITFMRKYD